MTKKSKEIWKVEKNVFTESSERNLFKLSSQGFFEELTSPLFMGKEANIFSARTKEGGKVIVKIYRLENCNFNKMFEYIRVDPRYINMKRGKRNIIYAWTQREFRNLMKARELVRVPTPIAFKENILVMEYIGHEHPALQVKADVPDNPTLFFKKVISNIHALYQGGMVHADLSEFNILNHDNEPVFIDFSQAMPSESPNADELLERDVKIICKFFKKYLRVDDAAILQQIKQP